MFGISLYEFLIIFILGVIFLNPKDFIIIAKGLLDLSSKIKSFIARLYAEVDKANVIKDLDEGFSIDKNFQDEEKNNNK